jgi:16S rRNA (guanine(966)-N(2))-methyltransferase RsmD
MRIISGSMSGRRIHPPAHMPHTRPTTDVAKEGLFNVIGNRLELTSLHALDLFGGTGSISFELCSRGIIDVVTVERDPKMYAFIEKTRTELGIDNMKVLRMDVFKFLEQCSDQYDFIFAGPPYALAPIDELPRMIHDRDLLVPGGWFVLEHTPRNDYKSWPNFLQERKYGTTIFSIFEKSA